MTAVSPHFNREELACKCPCDQMPFSDLAIEHLEALRMIYDAPMMISSGYRCPEHNNEVSTTGLAGPHTIYERDNMTVDVLIHHGDAYRLVKTAMSMNWTGIGLKQHGPVATRFVHLDRLLMAQGRPRPTTWSYA